MSLIDLILAGAATGGLLMFFLDLARRSSQRRRREMTPREITLAILDQAETQQYYGREAKPQPEPKKTKRGGAPMRSNEAIPPKGLKADLMRAGVRMKPGEFWLLSFGICLGLFLLMVVLGKGEMMAIAAALIGFYAPRWWVKRKKNKRIKRFIAQLADALTTTASALRAGSSTEQAFQSLARNARPPLKDEFERLVRETSAGVRIEQALDGMLNRVPCPELELVAIAIKLNREVGGNLADILSKTSDTIRDKEKLAGKLAAATSLANATTMFMMALPLLAFAALNMIQGDRIGPFMETGCGKIFLAAVAFMLFCGYMLSKKMGKVEV